MDEEGGLFSTLLEDPRNALVRQLPSGGAKDLPGKLFVLQAFSRTTK